MAGIAALSAALHVGSCGGSDA